jgi:uncharacterized membrane protein
MKKVLLIATKILVIALSSILLIVCASDLINYLKYPENYFIGSEVVDKSGWTYSSKLAFILSNSIHVALSVIISIMTLKTKKMKYLFLFLLFVICQIVLLILL